MRRAPSMGRHTMPPSVWSTLRMSAVMASLIAVAGTLLGSFSTHLFQQRTMRRAETVARDERLRQDRLAACGEFAAAATDLKRGVIATWFRREGDAVEYQKALAEADRLGAAAESARFRLLLLMDDPVVRRLAEAVLRHMTAIGTADTRTELEEREVEFEADLSAFVGAAAEVLR